MNIEHILNSLETQDPEVHERLSTRRAALKDFASFSSKAAVASLPFAFAGMFKKAYGQTSSASVTDVLNFALKLEYLEAAFYVQGLQSMVIPMMDRAAFQTISDHETAHVTVLQQSITALGGTPVSEPDFDFTAGNGSMSGPFSDVFTNYATFLAVSQTFEDTGVRAYKGQAGNLISNNAVLRAALQIHSVEARHAAHVREIRSRNGFLVPAGVMVQPWITLNQSGIATPLVQASYNGEELVNQAGVNIVGINGFDITAEDASEAFDEPLTLNEVLAIVDPFIVG